MPRKTYEAETILRKKGKGPFPKEVINEVKLGEGLFPTLFANKIKEIKHQVKCGEKKQEIKKKSKKVPSREVLQKQPISFDASDLVDPFDALLITQRNQTQEPSVSSHSSKLEFENDKPKIVRTREKECEVQDDKNKEKAIDLCETFEDYNSLASGNGKEEPSGFKKRPKFFSKDWKKNSNSSFKNKQNHVNSNDSLDNLTAFFEDLDLCMKDYLSGKVDIRGKRKEELCFKSVEGKTPSKTKSHRTLKSCSSPGKVENEKNENTSEEDEEDGEESSDDFLCACKGLKRADSKPINSTPAPVRLVESVPQCALSPILPILAQCSNEGSRGENENKLFLDSKLCPISATGFEDKCLHSEQENEELIKHGLEYNNVVCSDRSINNRAESLLRETNLSVSVINSLDPFADSEISGNGRILDFFNENDSACISRKHSKETISNNVQPDIVNSKSLYGTSSDQRDECEKQKAPVHNVTLRESSHYKTKNKMTSEDSFLRKQTSSVLKNVTHCHENCTESDRSENSGLSTKNMRTKNDFFCWNPKQNSSVQNQQNTRETLLNEIDTSRECSRNPIIPIQENKTGNGSMLLNIYSEKCEEKSSFQSQVNVNLEECLKAPRHELASILEESSVAEASIQKLVNSFARRRSHVVVPLKRDFKKRSSGFRDAYLSSNASLRLTLPSTFMNYNIIEESHLDQSEKKETTFKDIVLDHCEQSEILNFSEAFPNWALVESKKIGEGVYGEVFSCKNSKGVSTVIKIMPIEGSTQINGEPQKTYEEILPEIVITMELSNLRANENFCTSSFPELTSCWCVHGPYPSKLLQLWHAFDKEKSSENDSPEILPEDQVYIVLELSNVGSAMEGFTFSSALQAHAAFTQITYTLAAAEGALEFEHRDLHWGNILIKKTKARSLSWKLNGKEVRVQTSGIQASVIDFTLSRITYDGCSIYNNLANDPEIFEGQGDYQFEIYRLMRNKTENNWDLFEPYTNVLWLSYILEKLISEVYYHNKTGKAHLKELSKLQHLRKTILDFKSATDVALSLSKIL